jgi:hypothetical protein
MQPIFIINPEASLTDIKDTINSTLNKLKAILNCIMLSKQINHIEESTTYHALWAADDLVDNINLLLTQIEKLQRI